MKKKYLILTFLLFSVVVFSQNIKSVPTISLKNFHKVDEGVYRSSQPKKSDFKDLEAFGIKEVLNLRRHHSDEKPAKGTDLKLHWVKMRAGALTEEHLLKAFRVIRDREGDILIHCHHGSDRTGAIIAMYRILYQGWTKKDAIEEMISDKYGFHSIYSNIPKLINGIDIDAFRDKLDIDKP